MITSTLSDFDFYYVKLLVSPRSSETRPIDHATLHVLLQQAALEAHGTVGASLGSAMTIVNISNVSPEGSDSSLAREVVLRLSSSYATLQAGCAR